MRHEREMIVQAVLDNILSSEYLYKSEVEEILLMTEETKMEKLMDEAAERGCSVFGGFEGGDTLQ